MEWLVFIALLAIIVFYGWRIVAKVIRKTTVFEYETGLKYVDGKMVEQLGPGSYWHSELKTTIQKIDTRPSPVTVPSQEVLTKDGVAVKLSLAATISIADAQTAVHQVSNYEVAYYLTMQQALRQVVSELSIDELLAQRAAIGERVEQLVAEKLPELGIKASDVGVKDITFPGALKQTFTQVVKARQDALAALERARGESAALRNLANSAKLLDKNPALMQLRMLQALDESSGNTVVLNMTPEHTAAPGTAANVKES